MNTYDLLVFSGYTPNKLYPAGMTLFSGGNSSQACTGIVKLAQRWLMEFLTELGSQTNTPTRGCLFMTLFRNGQLQTESAVTAQFIFCSVGISNNLQSDNTAATPADEILDSASLDTIVIQPGNLQLAITITSAAGNSVQLYAPIGAVDITGT